MDTTGDHMFFLPMLIGTSGNVACPVHRLPSYHTSFTHCTHNDYGAFSFARAAFCARVIYSGTVAHLHECHKIGDSSKSFSSISSEYFKSPKFSPSHPLQSSLHPSNNMPPKAPSRQGKGKAPSRQGTSKAAKKLRAEEYTAQMRVECESSVYSLL